MRNHRWLVGLLLLLVSFTAPGQSATLRNWWENPGQDGSMWVQPFYNSATWDKSSATYTQLFSNGGNVNIWPNYAAPFYTGQSTDPTGTVTDGTHTITVHLPAGVQVEQPTSSGDQSIGGVDRTQPYLFWNISGATIDGSAQGTWHQGSVIRGTYGFVVGDASGLILEDVVVGTTSQNAMGNIQEYELLQANASSSYVIQHMLAFQAPSAFFSNSHIWPLSANDSGGSGIVPEGTVIGIPFSDVRPTGKSRAWYLLYDNLKQYGWIFYNTGPSAINIMVIPQSSGTQSLASDIGSQISDVLTHAAILTNQTGPGSIKGYTTGATSPYPSPPLLDYSPTGGAPVLPSTFGAWYPGGYNVASVPGSSSSNCGLSPNNTVITSGTSGTINDSAGNVWSVPRTNTQVFVNGTTISAATAAAKIAFASGVVWYEDTSNNWRKLTYSSTTGVAVGSPTTASPITGGTGAPAPAAAVGYTTRTYGPSVVVGSTANGGLPKPNVPTGANWYPFTYYGTNWQNIGFTVNGDGSISLSGAGESYGNGLSTSIVGPSGATSRTQITGGVAFGGGAYFEATMKNSGGGPMSFWSNDVESMNGSSVGLGYNPWPGQAGGYRDSIENDFMEFDWPNHYSWSVHNWYNSTSDVSPAPYGGPINGTHEPGFTGCPNSNPSHIYSPPNGVDYTQYHKYGFLWVPATSTSLGYGQPYFDGNPVGNKLTWNKYNSALSPPPTAGSVTGGTAGACEGNNQGGTVGAGNAWSVMDNLHLSLILGAQTGGGSTTTISSVEVWQASAAANLPSGAPTKTQIASPLTGAVTPGAWTYNQQYPLAGGPSSFGSMRFNVLLPAQYNPASFVYPLLITGGQNDQGMNGSVYPKDGAQFIGNTEASGLRFNTTTIRTAHPAIVISVECDQTKDLGGGSFDANCGGYNDAPNSSWNERAISKITQAAISNTLPGFNLSVDPTRVYCAAGSLMAIGCLAQLVDNNAQYATGLKLFTAAIGMSDQLYRPGVPNSSVFSRMVNVPYLEICKSSDNPCNFGPAFWTSITGNSSYPVQSNYDSSGMAGIRAGSSQFYFINEPSGTAYGDFGCMNADGCDGTTSYAWLFQQQSGTVTAPPPPTGNFTIAGGYLIDPTGAKFIPEGPNVSDYVMGAAIQNSSGFPITTLYPHVNYIRVSVCNESACAINGSSGGGQPTSITYPPASNYLQIANWCQANRIACEFEDHSSNGGYWEGVGCYFCAQSYPPTGALLTSHTTFWAAMATQFKGNPYAWIGTLNELGIQSWNPSDIARYSAYDLAMYNAIRATGNNNIIDFQAASGGIDPGGRGQNTMGPAGGLVTADYRTMTNVMFRMHYYDSDIPANIEANAAGAACPNSPGHGYKCQQGVLTADGVPPIIINELGGNTGDGTSTDGANMATAMTFIQKDGIGAGYETYFNEACGSVPPPGNGGCRTEVNNGLTLGLQVGTGGNTYYLSTWGKEVAAAIAANPYPGGNGTVQGGTPSPNGTTISPGNGTFTDGTNTYSITLADVAQENGIAMAGGTGTGAAEWCNAQAFFQDLATGNWYIWNGTGFNASAAPTCNGSTTQTFTTTPARAAAYGQMLMVQGGISGGGAPYIAAAQQAADMNYLGISRYRDGVNVGDTTPSSPGVLALKALQAAGITMNAQVPYPPNSQTPATVISQIEYWQSLGTGFVTSLEGINEPGLFYPTVNYGTSGSTSATACSGSGGGYGGDACTWLPVAHFEADYYTAVRATSALNGIPVYGASRVGEETDNVGLQWLTIPSGPPAGVLMPANTQFADAIADHVYPQDQGSYNVGVLNACQPNDPVAGNAFNISSHYNHVTTFVHAYSGYASDALAQAVPRAVTEFGYHTSNGGADDINEDKKGRCSLNATMVGFALGLDALSFYNLYDLSTGGTGPNGIQGFGLFASSGVPNLSGTYLHNLTGAIKDTSANANTFTPTPVTYSITGASPTMQWLVFQTGDGHYKFAIWDNATNWNFGTRQPITVGPSSVTVQFTSVPASSTIQATDPITGTTTTPTTGNSIVVSVADYPVIINIGSATVAAANFSISGGLLKAPNGAGWISAGLDIGDANNQSEASCCQNASNQPLTTLFPGINHLRTAVFASNPGTVSAAYPTPATYLNYVQNLTGFTLSGSTWTSASNNHSVVEFYDAATSGLGPLTGAALNAQTAWYQAMALYFNGNPYVWFGSPGKMNSTDSTLATASIAPMSATHLAIYNAIRGPPANSGNIFVINAGVGASLAGSIGSNAGFVVSDYSGMTNILWGLDLYYSDGDTKITGGQTYATTAAAFVNGGASIQTFNGGWGIAAAQTIQSADGVVPVMIDEWGSDTGSYLGTDSDQIAAAIVGARSGGTGSAAARWYGASVDNGAYDAVNGGFSTTLGGPTITALGTIYAQAIAGSTLGNGPAVTAPSTITAIIGPAIQSVAIPGISVTDTLTPTDTITITATSSGIGTLSAIGASGNGTTRITASGTLAAMNTLLASVTYLDLAAETSTLTWTAQDAHSHVGSATTSAVTSLGSTSQNCTTLTGTAMLLISAGPPAATWGITSGGRTLVNGVADPTTSNVLELAYVSNAVYYQNTGGNWFTKTIPSATWAATTTPIPSCSAQAVTWNPQDNSGTTLSNGNLTATSTASTSNNTIAAGTGKTFTDANGNVWSINCAVNNCEIYENGVAPAFSSNVALAGFVGTAPTGAGGTSPNGTRITSNNGSINDGTNTWTIKPYGASPVVYENGVIIPQSHNTVAAEWCNGQTYFQDGSTGTWFIWNGSFFIGQAGAPTCPLPATQTIYQENTSSQFYYFTQTGTNVGTWTAYNNGNPFPSSGGSGVRDTVSVASPQKVCWEITAPTITLNWSVGLSNASFVLAGQMGLTINSIGFLPNSAAGNQTTLFNSVALGAAGASPSVSGEVVTQCADLGAQLLWTTDTVQIAASNTWNNSATANPATGVGGASFSGMPGPYFVTFQDLDVGGVAVLNAGGPFQVSTPTGFVPVGGTQVSTVGHPLIIILGSAANDNQRYALAQ